ncbi:hypothetical protein PFWH6_4888 [Pseudomonas fluorescens WH6]|nr:hypothetical protein PFWH6_4888 [Pseudomonas fluorescens WH6]
MNSGNRLKKSINPFESGFSSGVESGRFALKARPE